MTSRPITIDLPAALGSLQLVPTDVRGVAIVHFPRMNDNRGELTVGEFRNGTFPFLPQRHFIISGVPPQETRGEHAHKQCHQLLICVRGRCIALCDDGKTRREFVLESPSVGLHVPPMVWGTQHSFSHDGTLLVLASAPYDSDDYIRDYATFQSAVRAGRVRDDR